jgi:hypothetical protein
MRSIILLLAFLFVSTSVSSQITISQFNADWNSANTVEWLDDLSDVDKVKYIDIAENTEAQDKHEIVVVPTIIVFKDGEEVKRFQADISFSIPATKEEIQEVIDETLMSDF